MDIVNLLDGKATLMITALGILSKPHSMEYMNDVESWWKQVMMYGNQTKKT